MSIVNPHETKTIIVNGTDIVTEFCDYSGFKISKKNLDEILTQIVYLLLADIEDPLIRNLAVPNSRELFIQTLPDYKRLVDIDDEDKLKISEATCTLAYRIYGRLKELQLYEEKTFSYYYAGLLGRDLMFNHLPY